MMMMMIMGTIIIISFFKERYTRPDLQTTRLKGNAMRMMTWVKKSRVVGVKSPISEVMGGGCFSGVWGV